MFSVRKWLNQAISDDAIAGKPSFKYKWLRSWVQLRHKLRRKLNRRCHGASTLPQNDDGDRLEVPSVLWSVPTELKEGVFHWLYLIGEQNTQKNLWITVDGGDKVDLCALAAADQIHSAETVQTAILVDVSKTVSVFWPLLHGLENSYPGFTEELARIVASLPLDGVLDGRRVRFLGRATQHALDEYYETTNPIRTLICDPLERIWERNTIPVEIANTASKMAGYSIIHGIRDSHDRCKVLDIIMISTPQLLRHVSNGGLAIMDDVYTLSVSGTGSSSIPGILLLHHCFLRTFSALFSMEFIGQQTTLHKVVVAALRIRRNLLIRYQRGYADLDYIPCASQSVRRPQTADQAPVISQAQIQMSIRKDNVEIAGMLQQIFQFKSVKQDIQAVPEEEAFSVLNLTHNILDRGLPENSILEHKKLFKQLARRLVNILADF
ncbi:hypothetical protein B0H13DRAFT_2333295 [Mycena leptocephala]|nr:hypothetical protein B0H13DRAFT_2333295 [Mycena leptocephala]